MPCGGWCALLGRRDVGSQGGLGGHGRGEAAQEGRSVRARLGEAEDVVYEQEDVLVRNIAEVLRHGQAGQGEAQTRAGRLVRRLGGVRRGG